MCKVKDVNECKKGINIKSFETNGEQQKKEKYLKHQNRILSEMAFNTSKILLEEYQNIVSTLQKNNYDKSFQVLMLLETLNKTYEINNDIENKIVHQINQRIFKNPNHKPNHNPHHNWKNYLLLP